MTLEALVHAYIPVRQIPLPGYVPRTEILRDNGIEAEEKLRKQAIENATNVTSSSSSSSSSSSLSPNNNNSSSNIIATGSKGYNTNNNKAGMPIPKEIWRLVDALWSGNALMEKDLFAMSGKPDEVSTASVNNIIMFALRLFYIMLLLMYNCIYMLIIWM